MRTPSDTPAVAPLNGNQGEAIIRAERVSKVFNAGKPSEFQALREATLAIPEGRVTVLKGPSGSGKTTLLGILGCMARPTAGRVFLRGQEITSLPERFLTEIRRRTNGFIFQHSNLIKGMTCLENVMFPAYTSGERHGVLKERAQRLLGVLNVADKAAAKVEWLSGGETQRVAIARALINDPPILIADEPTAHLDSALSGEFLEIMGRFREEGKTILMASHDPLVFESSIVDRVVGMRDGAVDGPEPAGVILHGPILALSVGSLAVAGILLYAALHALRILRHWDLGSGSERQLALERRTYLVTTLITWAFCFQLASLLLFVYVADDLSQVFVGAMCAAGSFGLNAFGYPALLSKIANFLLAGTWLVLNYVDNRAPDYPLIRYKYGLLLCMTPLVLVEVYLQTRYFAALNPNVITSCCGSLFSADAAGAQAVLFTLPRAWVQWGLGGSMGLTFASGLWFRARPRAVGAYLFSAGGALNLLVCVAAFIAYLCLHFYETPTHNCPFCVFRPEYGHAGYPLYLCLLGAAVAALGVGILAPFRNRASLRVLLPQAQRRLVTISLLAYAGFCALVAYRFAVSELVL